MSSAPATVAPSGTITAQRRQEALTGLLFVAPYVALFLVFLAAPLLYGFFISLHDWHVLAPTKPFIGLRNYRDLTHDDLFVKALVNTGYFCLLTVLPANAVSLALALGLNARPRGEALFKTLYYMPVILSVAVVAIIWRWMFRTEYGVLNHYLGLVHLQAAWLNSTQLAMPSLALMSIWWGAGGNMLIYLAGLRGIPEEYYEAARIDGAGTWARFRHITIPMLRPTLLFCLVMSLIASSQVFGQSYILTGGGPYRSTLTVALYMYQTGFSVYRMGYACAVAYALFLVVFVLTLAQLKFLSTPKE